MSEELKPCPFCGGNAFLEEHPPHKHMLTLMSDHPGSFGVECVNCSAGMVSETKADVIANWNTRQDGVGGENGRLGK